MNLNKENMKKAMYLITFAVLLYLGMQHLTVVWDVVGFVCSLLFPFILGAAIAFVLNLPMKFMEEKVFGKIWGKKNRAGKKLVRPLSLVCAIFLVVAVVMLVAFVVVPELGATVKSVVKQIEKSVPLLQEWLEENLKDDSQLVQWVNSLEIQPEKFMQTLVDTLTSGVNNILSSTLSLTMGIVNIAMNLGIGCVFACYALLQKEKLREQMKKTIRAFTSPEVYGKILYVTRLISKTFASFIACQCIEAVILGSMFFVTMTLFRFPYAMLVGVLIAFTALIPVFGAAIGCIIGFLLILLVNPMQAVMFLVLFFVLQQIEGNFIYPHVVGTSVGLPSIWVLTAVTVGGSLMGVLGMLVFIPLLSVIYSLMREWVNKRLEQKEKVV